MTPEDIEKKLEEYFKSLPVKQEPNLSSEQYQFVKAKLGYPGRLLSSSKRAVKNKDGREHLTVWNANLIVEGFGKVWFGDIDITNDEDKLKAIAKELKAKVYVLREHDARFENENRPKLVEAVYMTDGKTSAIPNVMYAQAYERDAVTGKYLSRNK